MFASRSDDDHPRHWFPYVISMTITAILSTIGTRLAEWVVDELRYKYGTQEEVPVAEPTEEDKQ